MGNIFSKIDLTENKKRIKTSYTTGCPELNTAFFNKQVLVGNDNNNPGTFEATMAAANTTNSGDASSEVLGGDTGTLAEADLSPKHSKQQFKPDPKKRYVRRYYIKPQNIFCSNKTDVLNALIEFEDQDMIIYTLNNQGDDKDVTKLSNRDVIYYYEDGILYDKNYVKIMDYDLYIKHEEERPKIDIAMSSDATVAQVYNDRITGAMEMPIDEAFNLDFQGINAYGEPITEGQIIDTTCFNCGEATGKDFEKYDGKYFCKACYEKFIFPELVESEKD